MALERELRDLAHVPRWSIARLINNQSVAEHSFYVTVYARELALLLGWRQDDAAAQEYLVTRALYHDAEESGSGDIPGPFKRAAVDGDRYEKVRQYYLTSRYGDRTYPRVNDLYTIEKEVTLILKLADTLEEVLFLAGEVQMGNQAIVHIFKASHKSLASNYALLWHVLGDSGSITGDPLKVWDQIKTALVREESQCSKLITDVSEYSATLSREPRP